jgi:hypothetical protein
MIAIRGIDQTMEVSYEGFTYMFPKGRTLLVEDNVAEFIFESWPMSFEKVKKSKKPAPKVSKKKTPAFTKALEQEVYTADDMKATRAGKQSPTFGQGDTTPPSGTTDGDGVGWYGEGAVIEGTGQGKQFS